MILVVIGHVLFYGGLPNSFACYAIYSFHMPLFFAISGFVASFTFRPIGVGAYLVKISKRLLVPYILWSIIYCLVFWQIDIPISDYWFIPCCWGLLAIFGIVEYIGTIKSQKYIKPILLINLIVGLVGFQMLYKTEMVKHMLAYIIPFYAGVCLAKFERLRDIMYHNKWLRIGCLLVWIATLIQYYYTPDASVASKLSRLVCGLSSIAVFFPLFYNLSAKTNLTERILELIGTNTIGIFFMHFLIVRHISLSLEWNVFLIGLVVLALAAIIISVCVLASHLLKKSAILKYLLLGK